MDALQAFFKSHVCALLSKCLSLHHSLYDFDGNIRYIDIITYYSYL